MNKPHLVVAVTRMSEPKLSSRDEYIHEWHFDHNKNPDFFLLEKARLHLFLLIHGHSGLTMKELAIRITKHLKDLNEGNCHAIGIYIHHRTGEEFEPSELEKLKTYGFHGKELYYSSTTTTVAPLNLLRILKDQVDPKLYKAIEEIIDPTSLAIAYLEELRLHLLHLRLNLHYLAEVSGARLTEDKESLMAEFQTIRDRIKELFGTLSKKELKPKKLKNSERGFYSLGSAHELSVLKGGPFWKALFGSRIVIERAMRFEKETSMEKILEDFKNFATIMEYMEKELTTRDQ